MTNQQLNRWQEAVQNISARNYKGVEKDLRKTYAKALRNIKATLKDAIENYDTLTFSQKMEADRLIAVAEQVQRQFNDALQESADRIHRHKADELEIGYYGEWYATEGFNRLELDLPILNKKFIEELVYNEVDGLRLSSRLYRNTRKVADVATEELLQGIIRGDGYAVIAKQIDERAEATYKQALRIARTEGAQSQSAAKLKEYEEEQALGIQATKTWLATLDSRTRHTHAIMDGQTVEIDEPFTLPSGQTAKAPGLSGIASEDIHCRCTMIKNTDGIPPEIRRDNTTGEIIDFKTYEQWAKDKGIETPSEVMARKKASQLKLREKQAEEMRAAVKDLATENYKRVSSMKQLRPAIDDRDTLLSKLTEDEKTDLTAYTGMKAAEVNSLLRFPDDYRAAFGTENIIKNMLTALDKSSIKEDLKTYRYINFVDDIKIGPGTGVSEIVDPAFLSTSPLPLESKFISNAAKHRGMLLEINVPKGTKGIYVDDIYSGNGEKELILGPGHRLQYVGERDADDTLQGRKVIELIIATDPQD